MAPAKNKVVIVGVNDLAADLVLALAERGRSVAQPPVVVGAGTGVRREHRVRLLDRGAVRELAAMLARLEPTVVVQLAVSESAVRPRRHGRYDSVIAETVAGALRLWHQRGGRLRDLIVLSSTVVYGVARSSPLLFSESSDGQGAAELGVETRYGRWAAELRRAERTYRDLAADLRAGLTLLRAAPVVGGPIASPVTELLGARLGVRVAGYDPPVQVTHYSDLIEALALAVDQRPRETLNIASRGVVPLSRLGALAGRVLLPVPRVAAALMLPEGLTAAALAGRCVADDRRAAQVLGFMPVFSAEEAVLG
ncbi:MAG: hypothetical protein D6760_02545 [Deltaproteobacteria bacterium]|nr:MAG: hypothetical protein D6760_02545 [Deltaproteobacteria bacterium]